MIYIFMDENRNKINTNFHNILYYFLVIIKYIFKMFNHMYE